MAFDDLKDIVSPFWNDLPYEKKEFYKNKAKGNEHWPIGEKKPILPQKPAELAALLLKEKQETMMEEVRQLVQNAYELGRKI